MNEYKDKLVKYTDYINEEIHKSYSYGIYLRDALAKDVVIFDEDNGVDLQEKLDELLKQVKIMIEDHEDVACEIDRLYSKMISIDTKINSIIKNV